jgi:hypothetical protein
LSRFVATALQQAATSETTSNQSNHYDNPQMSIELVTTALQVNATTGSGLTLTLPEARFITFKVQGVGPVTGGAITIERASMPLQGGNTPMLSSGWTALTLCRMGDSLRNEAGNSVSAAPNIALPLNPITLIGAFAAISTADDSPHPMDTGPCRLSTSPGNAHKAS